MMTSSTGKQIAGWVVALGVMGLLAWPKISASGDAASSNRGAAPPLGVDVTVVTPTTVTERIETTGTLRANESVALTAETSGKITSLRFAEGDRVAAGQLLFTINSAELEAQRERLSHELSLAREQAQRQAQLLQQGGVSQETYDETLTRVQVLEAEQALLDAQIAKTKVRAPFGGTVGLRYVSEGSYLTPQTTVAMLHDLNPLKLDFSVPEQYAGRVAPGQPIRFRVRGGDTVHTATIYAQASTIDPETRTLPLRARLANPARRLRPGAFADITVPLQATRDALTVPTFAVLPELGTQQVFVLERGVAQPRNVTLGVRGDSAVQITEGLAAGDTVITSGLQRLRGGLPVRVERVE
ncbi:efflux RND transporter periplasmic adaptor subunit [Salisaeta longa]|uniref:efflux RND transporter periplasmic adaptor subunit n=1 Tax=Salisaeta longa TaxID=503170 RepID=UPI0003B48F58|nr:efflux RND transporter periplasmic adaptor subunit [Salisaeta longa]